MPCMGGARRESSGGCTSGASDWARLAGPRRKRGPREGVCTWGHRRVAKALPRRASVRIKAIREEPNRPNIEIVADGAPASHRRTAQLDASETRFSGPDPPAARLLARVVGFAQPGRRRNALACRRETRKIGCSRDTVGLVARAVPGLDLPGHRSSVCRAAPKSSPWAAWERTVEQLPECRDRCERRAGTPKYLLAHGGWPIETRARID